MKKIIALLCCMCIVASFAGCAKKQNTENTAEKVAMSCGDQSVTMDMYTYWFNEIYRSIVSGDTSLIDVTADLKSQMYDADTQTTWYSHIEQLTQTRITQYLTILSAAENAGFDEADTVEKYTSKHIAQVESEATSNNEDVNTFLAAKFGDGVTEDTVRKCDDMYAKSELYKRSVKSSLEISDSDYDTLMQDEPLAIAHINYIAYSFKTAAGADKESVKAQAEKLASCTDLQSFKDFIYNYLVSQQPAISTYGEDSILKSYIKSDVTYPSDVSSADDFDKWAFADERQTGEIYTHYQDARGIYDVYMLMPVPENDTALSGAKYYDTYLSKNIRQIVFSYELHGATEMQSKAADMLQQYYQEALGVTDEDYFGQLADENSDVLFYAGGLTENVTKGTLDSDTIDDWVFSEDRKAGNVTVITGKEDSRAIYFSGDGIEAWKAEADTLLRTRQYNQKFSEWTSLYPVTTADENISAVATVNLAQEMGTVTKES